MWLTLTAKHKISAPQRWEVKGLTAKNPADSHRFTNHSIKFSTNGWYTKQRMVTKTTGKRCWTKKNLLQQIPCRKTNCVPGCFNLVSSILRKSFFRMWSYNAWTMCNQPCLQTRSQHFQSFSKNAPTWVNNWLALKPVVPCLSATSNSSSVCASQRNVNHAGSSFKKRT